MSTPREDELDLAAGYALGALGEAEQRRFEALLAEGRPDLEAVVREMSETATQLARSVPAATPPAGLRARVLAAAHAEPHGRSDGAGAARVLPLPARRTPFAWNAMIGWAAAAALLVVSWFGWSASQRTQAQLRAAEDRVAQLRQSLADEQKWAAVLSSPAAKAVQLGVTADGDAKLVARAAWDPATQHAVLLFENFGAPSGKDYQLWAIRGGKPASLGLIHSDANGRAIVELDRVGDAKQLAAFAVSLEPAGGSPKPDAPSGPVVMLGKVSG